MYIRKNYTPPKPSEIPPNYSGTAYAGGSGGAWRRTADAVLPKDVEEDGFEAASDFVPPPAFAEVFEEENESSAEQSEALPEDDGGSAAVNTDAKDAAPLVKERAGRQRGLLFPRGISSEDLLLAGLMLLLRGEENTEDIIMILGFLLISGF